MLYSLVYDIPGNETTIILAIISLVSVFVPTVNLLVLYFLTKRQSKTHDDVQDIKKSVNGGLEAKLAQQTLDIKRDLQQEIITMASLGGVNPITTPKTKPGGGGWEIRE